MLDIVVGHTTYCALVRRELLSLFGATYGFIHRHYWSVAPLGASAVAEPEAFPRSHALP